VIISLLDSNFIYFVKKTEGQLNVTAGHVRPRSASISKTVRDSDIVTMDN